MLATKNPRKVAADAPAARVGRIYQDAERELEALLRQAIDRGAQGTTRYLWSQLKEVNRIVERAHHAATPWADRAVEFGYRAGMASADAAAGAARRGVIGEFSGTTHRAAVERLARAQTSRLAGMRYEVGRQAMDVFRKAGLTATGGALAGGLTGQQAADRMKRDLYRQGITGFTASNGAKWRLSTYSQMVARTTTREAVTRGVTNRMMQNGDDLVEISDHGESDETCDQYAGNTYSLSGNTAGYDVLEDEPPFHPNCVHVMFPASLSAEELDQALGLSEPDLPELDSPAPAELRTLEERLQHGEITKVRHLRAGVSETYTANVGGHKAILKLSRKLDREAEHERAAYVLAEKLRAAGMSVDVPTTVLRTGRISTDNLPEFVADASQAMSAQEWSAGTTAYQTEQAALSAAERRDGHAMDVFDYVINNRDRHGSNYLVTPEGGLKLIDHGYAFDRMTPFPTPNAPKLRKAEAKALRTLLRKGGMFEVRDLLSRDQIGRMADRIEALLKEFDGR